MENISAKQYLQQLQVLDIRIIQNQERLSELKASLYGDKGIDYSRERVQTSPSADHLSSGVARYVDMQKKLNAEIDFFVDVRDKIIKEIQGLQDPDHVQILYKVYVQGKALRITAREMKYSYRSVLRKHTKALIAFEKKYPDLYHLI